MADTRTFGSSGIAAKNASTDLSNPTIGITYRNTGLTKTQVEIGILAFGSIADSANMQQENFITTSFTDFLDGDAIIVFYNLSNYVVNAIAKGDNGLIYQCIQENGISSIVVNPTLDVDAEYWIILSNIWNAERNWTIPSLVFHAGKLYSVKIASGPNTTGGAREPGAAGSNDYYVEIANTNDIVLVSSQASTYLDVTNGNIFNLPWNNTMNFDPGSPSLLVKVVGGDGLIYKAKQASGPSFVAGAIDPVTDLTRVFWGVDVPTPYDLVFNYMIDDATISIVDNLAYKSLVNNNVGNEPSVSPTEWLLIPFEVMISSIGNVSGEPIVDDLIQGAYFLTSMGNTIYGEATLNVNNLGAFDIVDLDIINRVVTKIVGGRLIAGSDFSARYFNIPDIHPTPFFYNEWTAKYVNTILALPPGEFSNLPGGGALTGTDIIQYSSVQTLTELLLKLIYSVPIVSGNISGIDLTIDDPASSIISVIRIPGYASGAYEIAFSNIHGLSIGSAQVQSQEVLTAGVPSGGIGSTVDILSNTLIRVKTFTNSGQLVNAIFSVLIHTAL